MEINLPAQVRAALYVLTVVGTPVVTYLSVVGTLSDAAVVLWGAEVTAISLLARLNVTK